jgi:predicted ATP-dependent endonuclease of OLD family
VHLSSLRITNYKSFADSGLVRLESGFNVVVGRNNVGMTALEEAISLRFSDKPHRSLNTVPPDSLRGGLLGNSYS